jgi:hypothetical protein
MGARMASLTGLAPAPPQADNSIAKAASNEITINTRDFIFTPLKIIVVEY